MAVKDTDELLERAMRLPADERLALARELIDSVESAEDPGWADAWSAELDRRSEQLESGTAKSVPWEEVKAQTQSRLRAR